jgi:hypothetical protein
MASSRPTPLCAQAQEYKEARTREWIEAEVRWCEQQPQQEAAGPKPELRGL